MSYIVAHVKFGNSRPIQYNCFRTDIQEGDEVVVKMEDGTLKYARVFTVRYLNWNCGPRVECLASEANLKDGVITLPEGDTLSHKGLTRDEDLKRRLDEFGWVNCRYRVANKIGQSSAYMWVNKNRTALISFRSKYDKSEGIDVQIWSGQPDVEMSSNNVLRVRPPTGKVIWQPYHDSQYNVLERTANFAREFQKDRTQPRIRGAQKNQSTRREPDEDYTTKNIYDAFSDGTGGKIYLSDGVYIDENGDWS